MSVIATWYGIGELSSNLQARGELTKLEFVINDLLSLAGLGIGRAFSGSGSFGSHLDLRLQSVLDGNLDGFGSSLDRRLEVYLRVGRERIVDRSPTRGHESVL